MRIELGSLILPGPVEIQNIHAATIRRHGGDDACPDRRKVDAAIKEVVIYHAYSPDADMAQLAAVVAYSFAKGHPLPDGNKRVALASIKMVLRANGFTWKPRHSDAENMMWQLAESPTNARERVLNELAEWIRQDIAPVLNCEAYTPQPRSESLSKPDHSPDQDYKFSP